jgi:choline dehydrogenase-like flavoprotein
VIDLSEFDVVIVGSGPAGIMAASELVDHGMTVAMVDSGIAPPESVDIEKERVRDAIDAGLDPDTGSYSAEYRMGDNPPLKTLFGSAFAQEVPAAVSIDSGPKSGFRPSFAAGGLSNVWGASVLPFRAYDISEWPIAYSEFEAAYETVLGRIPVSSVATGGESLFPQIRSRIGISIDPVLRRVLRPDRHGRRGLGGLHAVPGTLAIVTDKTDERYCRSCGLCLSGCAYDSIFSTAHLLPALSRSGLRYLSGITVIGMTESDAGVTLRCVDGKGQHVEVGCSRVFLGAGPVSSSALVLDAFRDRRPVELADCQAVTVPLLSIRPFDVETHRSTLTQVVVGHLADDGRSLAHYQIYGTGHEVRTAVSHACRRFRLPEVLTSQVVPRGIPAHGFLRPEDSGVLRVLNQDPGTQDRLRISVEAVVNARTRVVVSRRLRVLALRGLLVLWPLAHIEEVGRSYHVASSFPISATVGPRTSDLFGRPAGLKRVHLIDASSLPTVPPQSPTLTVMAHATRIAGEVTRNFIEA